MYNAFYLKIHTMHTLRQGGGRGGQSPLILRVLIWSPPPLAWKIEGQKIQIIPSSKIVATLRTYDTSHDDAILYKEATLLTYTAGQKI